MTPQKGTITTIAGALVAVLTALSTLPALSDYSGVIAAVAGLVGALALVWAKDPNKTQP